MIRTFDHIIAVLNCAVLHSHVHDLEPCCGRHASPMRSSCQAAQPHCHPVSLNCSNSHRPKSLTYTPQCRFRCLTPCHHSRKIRQSLVAMTCDDEFFFWIYSCRPSPNTRPRSGRPITARHQALDQAALPSHITSSPPMHHHATLKSLPTCHHIVSFSRS